MKLAAFCLLIFCIISSAATASMQKPLRCFLQNCRVAQSDLNFAASAGVTYVLGNEAADADSIISSLTYAYLKQWMHEEKLSKSHEYLRTPIIPITAIKRNEIHLRRDVELLLREVGLELSDIICVDECNLAKASAEGSLDLILVDHNVISTGVSIILGAGYSDLIVKEVLDHHEDGGAHTRAVLREIAFDMTTKKTEVASTCTIIAEKYLDQQNVAALTEEIATLLIALIALDSLNMDPKQRRGTDRDQKALNSLLTLFPNIKKDQLYSLLINAKTDPLFWMILSAKDSIRLDFKDFQFIIDGDILPVRMGSFGIASVLQPGESFLEKEDLNAELMTYFYPADSSDTTVSQAVTESNLAFSIEANDNDMLVIMTLILAPEVRRSLLYFSKSKSRIETLSTFLEAETLNLKLSRLDLDRERAGEMYVHETSRGAVYMAGYHQGNVEMSRKQIAPILSAYYTTENLRCKS